MSNIEQNPDQPSEPLSTDKLEKELAAMHHHNQIIKEVTTEVSGYNKCIEERNALIADLESQLSELRKLNDEDQQRVNSGLRWLDSYDPIDDEQIKETEMQIAAVKDENEKIVFNNTLK